MDLVKNNEPHLALYADNNGLAIYERIFKECKEHLNEEFIIGLELNSLIYQEIFELAKEYFDKSELILKKIIAIDIECYLYLTLDTIKRINFIDFFYMQ